MPNLKQVGFHAPLNDGDTPEETVGCRATHPDMCRFNGTDFCAFCRADGKCMKPPKTWPKQYDKLKSEEGGSNNG